MSAVSPISETECCRLSNSQSAAESPIPPIKTGRRKLSVIFPFLWVFPPSLTLPGLAFPLDSIVPQDILNYPMAIAS
jgi:hypothetical protein